MKFHKILTVIFCSLTLLIVQPAEVQAISIPKENELAKKFMDMVEKQQMILQDPIAGHMVKQVGRHILSFLPSQPFDYSFYVIDEDMFNAFASPGANIFVYRGLITSLDSIDELAGIIGHEIAHAASRHVSESIDRSKYISIGSLAGLLAGAIIGSQSDGSAGTAVIQGSLGLGQTAMLAFTRENETEADEKGILFLKQSCFSPEGLLGGLMKIRASDYRGAEGIPEYVKTHPGTGNRIAHTETILAGYVPPENKPACSEDFRFDMVKYRLLGLYADIDPTFKRLTTLLEQDPSNAALHYGMGLVYARKFRTDEALEQMKKALSINIFDPMVLLEMGRIYLLKGEPGKALSVLEGLRSDPVIGIMAAYHEGEAQLTLGNLSEAKKLFSRVIEKIPEAYPKAYFHQANILSQESETARSHYYLGIYYSETGNPKTAVVHLNKALEDGLVNTAEKEKAKELLEKLNADIKKALAESK